MRKKRWIRISLLACLLIAGVFVFLMVRQKETPGTITARDIRDCELYISASSRLRKVKKEDYRDEVAPLVTKVVPLRPVKIQDIHFVPCDSAGSEPFVVFANDNVLYGITFQDGYKQISIDHVNRDNPIVCVSKNEVDEYGDPHLLWLWYCTMSAADYAILYELAVAYTPSRLGGLMEYESLIPSDYELAELYAPEPPIVKD